MFWPQPKVDAAIIKIIPKKTKNKANNINLFFKILKAGFSCPRKKILNNLSENLQIDKEKIKKILEKNNISPLIRPENLTLKNWQTLTQTLNCILNNKM